MGWLWNVFDLIIVALAIIEIALLFSDHATRSRTGESLSFFRVVRFCRLFRMIRLSRHKFFRDLLMMVDGMIGGIRTLLWALLLLAAPLYIVAVFLRETLGESTSNSEVSKPFVTLGWSFFTIFRCVFGDCSSETGTPIFVEVSREFGWIYGAFYVAVVALTSIGLFNVIIAIFVENTLVAAKANANLQQQRRLSDEKRTIALLADLTLIFLQVLRKDEVASDDSGCTSRNIPISVETTSTTSISAEQFHRVFAKPEVQALLDQLDIASEDRRDLFEILDADGSGSLTIGEVVNGVSKLRGEPKRSDIIENCLIARSMQKRLETFEKAAMSQIALIAKDVTRSDDVAASSKTELHGTLATGTKTVGSSCRV